MKKSYVSPSGYELRCSEELASFAAMAHLHLDDFKREFGALIEDEPPPLHFPGLPEDAATLG